MTPRENTLRAVRFERPEYIPMGFAVNGACWQNYDQAALQDLLEGHPLLFPGYERKPEPYVPGFGSTARAGEPYTDGWGCTWETTEDGIVGTVTGHPLESWDAFAEYAAPDPETSTGVGPMDWDAVGKRFANAEAHGQLRAGGLTHGHTFLRLQDIRGYENLIFDMADDEPRLHRLINRVEEFNMAVVRRYLELGAEWMSYPEDLGMQVGPMLSPAHLQAFIKPSYQRLMAPAREAGCVVHMHSDGDIRELVDDLIDGGVEIINMQDLVNGIDWIAERFAGQVCIDLDIDRQEITPFGTPAQIDALIREEVEKLSSREGGLMMIYGLYPGVPLENVAALMDAMERYAGHWA